MAGKKNLGMGLDVLLTAVEKPPRSNDNLLSKYDTLLATAVEKDDRGEFLEAYHLYCLVIDMLEENVLTRHPELASLVSQALNNAAVILFEHNFAKQAREYLEKALKMDPNNQTARENLSLISGQGENK